MVAAETVGTREILTPLRAISFSAAAACLPTERRRQNVYWRNTKYSVRRVTTNRRELGNIFRRLRKFSERNIFLRYVRLQIYKYARARVCVYIIRRK